jgi:hypothetical protein
VTILFSAADTDGVWMDVRVTKPAPARGRSRSQKEVGVGVAAQPYQIRNSPFWAKSAKSMRS